MLSVISLKEAEALSGIKFQNYHNFNLHWTDSEDTTLIVNLLSKSTNILEIGTYLGHTTENIASNIQGQIITVDICEGMVDSTKYQNHEILPVHLSGSEIKSENVTRILSRSSDYFDECKIRCRSFDGIFLDGDHSYDQVYKDSMDAISIIEPGGIIVWHDVYNDDGVQCHKTRCQPNPPNYDVLRVLRELKHKIYKIERSWVAFGIF